MMGNIEAETCSC